MGSAIALACRLHSIYNTGAANFVQGDPWYQVYVDYAVSNGIITAGQFSDYNANATRRQFAAILAKALPSAELTAINTIADGAIPDLAAGSANYADIYTLYRAGVLTGSDQYGTFNPETTIGRSSVAAIVARMAVPSLRQSVTLVEKPADPEPTPDPGHSSLSPAAMNTLKGHIAKAIEVIIEGQDSQNNFKPGDTGFMIDDFGALGVITSMGFGLVAAGWVAYALDVLEANGDVTISYNGYTSLYALLDSIYDDLLDSNNDSDYVKNYSWELYYNQVKNCFSRNLTKLQDIQDMLNAMG